MVYMNVWRTAAASVGFVAVIGKHGREQFE